MRRRFGTWYIYGVVVYIYEKREGYIGNVQVRCTGNIYIQLCIYIYRGLQLHVIYDKGAKTA